MATLILSTVGSAVGGPLGSLVGSFVGQHIDRAIFGSNDREGPRLTDVAVQTSQYGALVPQIFGRMRVAGSVIWSTDLIERRERQGGGKGNPGTVQFAYSVSMAVALSSRPLKRIRRIWAEGNLLRGEAGDFKSQTGFRFYEGHGDQLPDPLIAALEGEAATSAYRGLSYCVFEDFDLAEFGNRIPSLTFEVEADPGALSPRDILNDIVSLDPESMDQPRELLGYAAQADRQAQALDELASAFPSYLDWTKNGLNVVRRDIAIVGNVPAIRTTDMLSEDGVSDDASERRAQPQSRAHQIQLRYYEPERDYQAGMRRSINGSVGRAPSVFDMPAALSARNAQTIVQRLYRFSQYQDHEQTVRLARLDPALRPGIIVAMEGEPGLWRVINWELTARGVVLQLRREDAVKSPSVVSVNAGRSVSAPDQIAAAGKLVLFDLPAFPESTPDRSNLLAAAGPEQSASTPDTPAARWRGGIIYKATADGGLLDPVGQLSEYSDIGVLQSVVTPSNGLHAERQNQMIVSFAGEDPFVTNTDQNGLIDGQNLLLMGREVIQFERAEFIGNGAYRLSRIYRALGDGHGGEGGHDIGTQCLLINRNTLNLSEHRNMIGQEQHFAMLSQGVQELSLAHSPVRRALRPLAPVHLSWRRSVSGGGELRWIRRARLPIGWRDGVDMPLVEEVEKYDLEIWSITSFQDGGQPTDSPLLVKEIEQPVAILSETECTMLRNTGDSLVAKVRQLGTYAISPPTMLHFIC